MAKVRGVDAVATRIASPTWVKRASFYAQGMWVASLVRIPLGTVTECARAILGPQRTKADFALKMGDHVPEDIRQIICCCTKFKPEERPSFSELRKQLQSKERDMGVGGRFAVSSASDGRGARRRSLSAQKMAASRKAAKGMMRDSGGYLPLSELFLAADHRPHATAGKE